MFTSHQESLRHETDTVCATSLDHTFERIVFVETDYYCFPTGVRPFESLRVYPKRTFTVGLSPTTVRLVLS